MEGERLWGARFVPDFILGDITPWCVIDRTPALEGRVVQIGRGRREAQLRSRVPERHQLDNQRDFFQRLLASVRDRGVKLPILLWRSDDRYLVRYGASRCWASQEAGLTTIPAVVCDFDEPEWGHQYPIPILKWLTAGEQQAQVGLFECSHERLDAHRIEIPY